MNLEPLIVHKLRILANQHNIEKMILFGSRARGDNHNRSDIDLAVWGIHDAVEEQIPTLLRFDLVDMDGFSVSDALREEINKDGVMIYEKI